MKKLLVFLLAVVPLVCFVSCNDEELLITKEKMVGKWLIQDKVGGFTTDCERTEYIIFNEDNTLLRSQCGPDITGTWSVENGQLNINISLDSTFANATYSSELLSETEIKVKCVERPYIWAKYKKE